MQIDLKYKHCLKNLSPCYVSQEGKHTEKEKNLLINVYYTSKKYLFLYILFI